MRHLFITCILLTQIAYSQKLEIEFGNISEAEVEMPYYMPDKTAKAVILYDKGTSYFFDKHDEFDIRFTRHKRIKVFDKSETSCTEVSIPYYVDGQGETEMITSIEAVTYNFEDGNVTRKRLEPSTIFEERISERWYNKKFVFPDVQDGAILEYRYVLETPFKFNLPDWTFQDIIPTIYSEYEVSMIPFYEYEFIVQGVNKFDYQDSRNGDVKRTWGDQVYHAQAIVSEFEFRDLVHTYALEYIPAFEDESYITSVNDYIIKMDFQLSKVNKRDGSTTSIISTWPELNEELIKHKDFGKYIKNCSAIAKKILGEELTLSALNETQKVKTIIDYVKNSFEWNGFHAKLATQSAKEFMTKKMGNSAEINLFMIALLNEAGIKTDPIILSTRDHGQIKIDYPFDHFTNYVIGFVNTSSPFLADGTEELLPYNKLPTKCYNGKALIVEKNETPRWINLENETPSIEKNTLRMKIDPASLDLITLVSIQNTEYESYSSRSSFKNDTVQIKKHYAPKIGDIHRTKTTGYDDSAIPYSMNFVTKYDTEKLGDNIVIAPFLKLPMMENLLKQARRSYPVDFIYPWENSFESTIEIPASLMITELPSGITINDDLAEISLSYSFENSTLTSKGKYKFKKSVYASNEYEKIKAHLTNIVKHFNQQIIFEKKK